MSIPLCRTADGSSSLVDPVSGQTMHAKEGAFSETLYIYGKNIDWALEHNLPLKICVMGLGLGYIELVSLALILKAGRNQEPIEILSFEKSDHLRNSFLAWLLNEEPSELSNTYNEILSHIDTHLKISPQTLKDFSCQLYKSNQWTFFTDPLTDLTWKKLGPFHIIQFDPYSKSANPELWQIGWLLDFLQYLTGTPCSFATYASNGSLKKALSQCGFLLSEKPGFGSKRESTFATRALS